MRVIHQCPVCDGHEFEHYLNCIDHTVSHETFSIKICLKCKLLITDPQPEKEELGKYYLSAEYISHSDKVTTIVDFIYKLARLKTLNWKHTLVKKYSGSTRTILDFGCGTGYFLEKCMKENHRVIGVEPSQEARKYAIQKTGEVITSDIANVTVRPDVITAWHVIEHVSDLKKTMARLNEILTQNGTVFIAVPNHRSYDARKYKEHWAGYDVPRHLWHFSSDNMKLLLEKSGLHLKEIVPMKLDSYYVSMLSEKYRTGSLSPVNLLRAFYAGLKSNLKASGKLNHSSLVYIAEKK